MDKDLDTLEEALSFFSHAFSRPKAWEQILRTAGITIDRPSAHLLHALCASEGSCKLHELAAKLAVEAPSITRTVQQMEHDKLVRRIADPHDRRAVRIVPTARGKTIIKRIAGAKRERVRAMLSGWSAHDRHQLVQLLHRLASESAHLTTPPKGD